MLNLRTVGGSPGASNRPGEDPFDEKSHEIEGEDQEHEWTRTQLTVDLERSSPPESFVDDWDDSQDPAHPSDETRFLLADEEEEDLLDEGPTWNVFGEIGERVEWSVDDYLLGKAMEDFFGLVTFTLVFCATINGIRI